jgi:hypothetical protein
MVVGHRTVFSEVSEILLMKVETWRCEGVWGGWFERYRLLIFVGGRRDRLLWSVFVLFLMGLLRLMLWEVWASLMCLK